MNYREGVPFMAEGIDCSQISFSGGRTAASLARHGGLTHVNYYGAQRFGDVAFYKGDCISAWSQLLRPGVVIDGTLSVLEFHATHVYPFGYSSHCTFDGIEFEHGMWLLNDALVFTIEAIRGTGKKSVLLRMANTECCTRVTKETRTWSPFVLQADQRSAIATVLDVYPEAVVREEIVKAHECLAQRDTPFNPQTARAETLLGIVSSGPLTLRETPKLFQKLYAETPLDNGCATFTLAFGHEGSGRFTRRLAGLSTTAADEARALLAGYRQTRMSQPQIKLPEQVAVTSFLENAGPVLDSLKVKDIPGGMRAADSGYWIWGWDSMVHSEALGFLGDAGFLRDLLDFYRRTSDPQTGIIHALTIAQQPYLSMATAPQCLYAVLLYNAYLFSGDGTLLAEYLPFARQIMERAARDEVGASGLLRGVALYPDQPEDLEQDGDDISAFNNSIYFQALRVMACLEDETGSHDVANDYAARAARTKQGFRKFYDEDKGYFWDSLSANDFSARHHYPLYAVLWVTPFAAELIAECEKPVAHFMRENFPIRHGLRMFPQWDSRFMYDGNQLGMYMPVIENFHREMQLRLRDPESIPALLQNIAWFWEQCSIPEALTCEYVNHGLTLDNPGRKQAFCAKAWLTMFYHVVVGLNMDLAGISFAPSDGPEVTVRNLLIRGKRLDISLTGRGWNRQVFLNGQPIGAEGRILYSQFKEVNVILIQRSEDE